MIITARISSSNGYNRLELLSLRLSRFLLKLNDFLFSLSKNILGIIGLIIIIPILFLLAIIGWFLMLGLNYSLERDRDEFNTLVNTWDERRKMEELLKLEGLVNQLAKAMKSSQEKNS